MKLFRFFKEKYVVVFYTIVLLLNTGCGNNKANSNSVSPICQEIILNEETTIPQNNYGKINLPATTAAGYIKIEKKDNDGKWSNYGEIYLVDPYTEFDLKNHNNNFASSNGVFRFEYNENRGSESIYVKFPDLPSTVKATHYREPIQLSLGVQKPNIKPQDKGLIYISPPKRGGKLTISEPNYGSSGIKIYNLGNCIWNEQTEIPAQPCAQNGEYNIAPSDDIRQLCFYIEFNLGQNRPSGYFTANFTSNGFDIVTLLDVRTETEKDTSNVNQYVKGMIYLNNEEGILEIKGKEDGKLPFYIPVEIYYTGSCDFDIAKYCEGSLVSSFSRYIIPPNKAGWYIIKFPNPKAGNINVSFSNSINKRWGAGFYYTETGDGSLCFKTLQVKNSSLQRNGYNSCYKLIRYITKPKTDLNLVDIQSDMHIQASIPERIIPVFDINCGFYISKGIDNLRLEMDSGNAIAFYTKEQTSNIAEFSGTIAVMPGRLDSFIASGNYSTEREVLYSCTIAHEIGHALGKDHPTIGGKNSIMAASLTTIDNAIKKHWRDPDPSLRDPTWLPEW